MSEKLEDLKGLSQLANLVLDSQFARLASATRHRDMVQEKIANLEEEYRVFVQLRAGNDLSDTQDFQGSDKRWQDWRRAARASLNTSLANAAAARESERKVTKRAYGRARAIEELLSMRRD